MKDESIHVVVTDPPYGMSSQPDVHAMLKAWLNGKEYKHKSRGGYLNNEWDLFVPDPMFWKEIYRVLKPGGWCLAFYSTRTYDIGTLAMRLAGFEVTDCIQWIYGLSSPRSQRLDRSIDRRNGVDIKKHYDRGYGSKPRPQSDDAKKWSGWGTNLRPACDLIAMTRKPLLDGSVVANVLKHGVGAINIEGCRIPLKRDGLSYDAQFARNIEAPMMTLDGKKLKSNKIPLINEDGRFPSHIILDVESGKILDSVAPVEVSRFFYQTKVSRQERDFGTEGLPYKGVRDGMTNATLVLRHTWDGGDRKETMMRNTHPTVKPVALMRYLIRMVAPAGTIVLDPFMGSGSSGIASMLEGCRFRGMEMDKNFFKIANSRIEAAKELVVNHPVSTIKGIFG